ncbi:Asp23/Gls24 family envelope stress response protein [Pseudonocardia sp. C8]|uniref:Asp23/Gls24 family envelope stress response protein n=1 Tax=Pseudonocardia sp. C8 TaxID=2762759 RepID=UPI0016435245|nr:Asp23/Gls24 family envelope stress response protein [Pseudonocardia sp. C8]MBC3190156.1 Asp23/Gls24 family envelope stress response protein [Pseudonocardia sp. C8]
MSAGEQDAMGTERLVCGRSADELIDQVASGRGDRRDAHQQDCVHCRAALAEYSRLWSPVQDLAAEKITAPEGRFDRMMSTLRGVLSEPDYATLPGPDGVTRIAARVVVVTARRSAQQVPGVRVALSRKLDGDAPGSGVSAGVAGTSTVIEIVLAANYGEDLHALADRVRRTVTERVRALTGLSATEITVVIDDVLE